MLVQQKLKTAKFTQEQIDYLRGLGCGRPDKSYEGLTYDQIMWREAQEQLLQHMQQNIGELFNNRA